MKQVQTDIAYRDQATKDRLMKNLHRTQRRRLYTTIFLSIFWPLFFMGTCFSFYNTRLGILLFGQLNISTAFMRFLALREACPPGAPCHIYATLPEDAATGVFINAHTNTEYDEMTVYYDTQDFFMQNGYLRNSVLAYAFTTDIEKKGNRNVHSALLSNLTPDEMYTVQLFYDGKVQATENYRTLPDNSTTRDIVFASGGDAGVNDRSGELAYGVGSINPDVVVVGGDLAYDDNLCSCYYTWDYYLNEFEKLYEAQGRLVPLLFSVGNHDVGLNEFSGVNIPIDNHGPAYMMYFPQHTYNGGVPTIYQRRSYHYHIFGNVLHFNLDSGYLVDYNGTQLEWLINITESYPSYIKMANYHIPTFWVCKVVDAKNEAVYSGLNYWNPIFDKYKFIILFENHEHTLKKTFRLKGNKINEEGAFFVGNGNMGAHLIDDCHVKRQNNSGLLDLVEQYHHFWAVNVSVNAGVVQLTAFDNKGNQVVPSFEQIIANYVNPSF